MSNSKLSITCQELFHPNNTCTGGTISSVKELFIAAAKANWPFYFFAAQKRGINEEMIKTFLINMTRTLSFYAISVALFSFLRCNSRNIIGVHDRRAIFLSGVVAYGLGSLFEEPNQLQGTLLFQGKDTLETIAKLLVKWGWLPAIKNAEVYVFAFSLSILYYYFQHNPECGQAIPFLAIKQFIGKNRSERESFELLISQHLESPHDARKAPDDSWKLTDVFAGVIKNVIIGYSVPVVMSIFGGIYSQRSIKGFLIGIKSGHPSGTSVGFFLGMIALVARGIPILLKMTQWGSNKKKDKIISLISGFLAGLCMFFWKSTSIANFFLANALCCICKDLVNRKIVKPIPYLLSILYGISTGISLYALHFDNETVSASWKVFLTKLAGGQDYQKISALLK